MSEQYIRYPAAGPTIPSGLTPVGSANQLLGVTAAGGALEYKTLAGTINQITVTNAANLITLSLPQAIATTSSPTFNGLTVTTINGGTISGNNSGDVTLGTANGLTLTGQVLSLPTTATPTLASLTLAAGSSGSPALVIGTGTGIYSSGSNVLVMQTNSIPAWSIDASGNLLPLQDEASNIGNSTTNRINTINFLYSNTAGQAGLNWTDNASPTPSTCNIGMQNAGVAGDAFLTFSANGISGKGDRFVFLANGVRVMYLSAVDGSGTPYMDVGGNFIFDGDATYDIGSLNGASSFSRPNNVYIATNLGINTSGVNHANAMLQLDSITKGFLPPRMTSAQMQAIASPNAGLVVFATDIAPNGKLCVYTSGGALSGWETITSA